MYKYKIKMNFNTDGDFSWFLTPPGFQYDGDENYSFERYFYSKDSLQSWIEKYIPALISNLSGKDWVIENISNILDHMKKSFYNKGEIDFYEYMGGNYDGTYVSLEGYTSNMVLDLLIPDDLSDEMVAYGIDHNDILDGIKWAIEKKKNS